MWEINKADNKLILGLMHNTNTKFTCKHPEVLFFPMRL